MSDDQDLEALLDSLGAEESVQEKLQNLATACEEKLGMDPGTVFKDFEKTVEKIRKSLPDLEPKTAARRAFVKVRGKFKQELRSPAEFYEGIILGVSEPFDMVRRQRADAKTLFAQDPEKAIAEGITDSEGVPLDTREVFSTGNMNPRFGKPLPDHAYISNVFGLARKKGEETFEVFKMALGDNLATSVKVPVMKPVTFRANKPDNQRDPDVLTLNPYSRIEFMELDMDVDIEELITSHDGLDLIRCELSDIPEYHARVQSDPQRVVITVGDVQHLAREPNPTTNNRMMVLDDENLGLESDGITCWVPPHLQEDIDFGAGSRVVVVGSTNETQFQEGQSFLINVTGLYALPEWKLPPDENPQAIVSRDVKQIK